jgi:pre-mRNA-splicing helicase BRR2
MLKSPALYAVGADYQEDDEGLIQKRADIAHSAAVLLEKCQLIKYERSTGRFTSTELGRIASHYYVTYNSMMVYNQHLRPTMSTVELFRVFALSNEFKLLPVSIYSRTWYIQLPYVSFLLGSSRGKTRVGQASRAGADSC